MQIVCGLLCSGNKRPEDGALLIIIISHSWPGSDDDPIAYQNIGELWSQVETIVPKDTYAMSLECLPPPPPLKSLSCLCALDG